MLDQVWTGSRSNWNRWVDYDYTAGSLNRYYLNDNGNMRFYAAAGTNQHTGVWGSTAPSYDGNFNLTGSQKGSQKGSELSIDTVCHFDQAFIRGQTIAN